jgi:hypothetical protein
MTQRWVIPLLVALAFGAGFVARMWTERDGHLPHAPTPGTEFVRQPTANETRNETAAAPTSGLDRSKLIAEMDKVRPHIDVYRKRMDEIAKEFDTKFVSVLNAEQRAHWEQRQKMRTADRVKREAEEASGTLLSDQQIESLRRQPLWNALWNVAINWRLDFLCKEYKLDEAQRADVCGMLKTRRENFLALVDSTPPPSISYSELARQAQKLADPNK